MTSNTKQKSSSKEVHVEALKFAPTSEKSLNARKRNKTSRIENLTQRIQQDNSLDDDTSELPHSHIHSAKTAALQNSVEDVVSMYDSKHICQNPEQNCSEQIESNTVKTEDSALNPSDVSTISGVDYEKFISAKLQLLYPGSLDLKSNMEYNIDLQSNFEIDFIGNSLKDVFLNREKNRVFRHDSDRWQIITDKSFHIPAKSFLIMEAKTSSKRTFHALQQLYRDYQYFFPLEETIQDKSHIEKRIFTKKCGVSKKSIQDRKDILEMATKCSKHYLIAISNGEGTDLFEVFNKELDSGMKELVGQKKVELLCLYIPQVFGNGIEGPKSENSQFFNKYQEDTPKTIEKMSGMVNPNIEKSLERLVRLNTALIFLVLCILLKSFSLF